DCNERELVFHADDSHFQLRFDGRVYVKNLLKLHSHKKFIITARDGVGKEWNATVKVLFHKTQKVILFCIRGHQIVHTKKEPTDELDKLILWAPHRPNSLLRRQKREWVIPPIKHSENERGPFPQKLVQIKSNRDKETTIIYKLTGQGADQPPIGVFSIDKFTGWLSAHQPLDREQVAQYRLIPHAIDTATGEEAEDPMELVINVIDQNDNKPEFTDSTFYGSVMEGAASGTSFMNVSATDKDDPNSLNSLIVYSIVEQQPPIPRNFMFAISKSTGLISLSFPELDREKVDKYILVIQAADMEGDGLHTTATAIVTVLDQNDNAPQFLVKTSNAIAPENTVDYEVVRLSVDDNDLPHTPAWRAKYSIVDGNSGKQFSMETDLETNEGIVKIVQVIFFLYMYCRIWQQPLDFERKKQHVVVIQVENEEKLFFTSPLSSATVTITVKDVNEAPEFDPVEKKVKHPENLPVGATVTTYNARDPDVEQDQTIRYRMGSNPGNWLAIDSVTGVITVDNNLDRESDFVQNSIYTATILASDNGSPSATGTGTLLLELEDINDNGPVVDAPVYELCNKNPEPMNVTIIDKDIPPNTYPYYVEAVHGAEKNWTVEKVDGKENHLMIRLNKELEAGSYEVSLKVTDSGHPSISQVTGLAVKVCNCRSDGTCEPGYRAAVIGYPVIFAILGSILALLLLVLLLLLFLKKRKRTPKEPLLLEEDIRDSVYHYDEEGGGEEDQDFDLSQLHRGLDAKHEIVRNDVVPTFMPAPRYLPRPANPDEIGNFIDENLKAADTDPTAPPYDTLLVFDHEGEGSEAGSLSTINSGSNSDEDQDFDYVKDWGGRFKKIADMYGGEEE
uniref:Cadherin-1 n=1 Tax=Callorhinchus milii TaxID=7868 RepID=A0A4W3J7X1_CALMI